MDEKHDIEYSFCSNRNASGQQCPSMGGSGTEYSQMLELLRQELCFPCQRLVDLLRETAAERARALTTTESTSIEHFELPTVECDHADT